MGKSSLIRALFSLAPEVEVRVSKTPVSAVYNFCPSGPKAAGNPGGVTEEEGKARVEGEQPALAWLLHRERWEAGSIAPQP